jgi:hypothetical protein
MKTRIILLAIFCTSFGIQAQTTKKDKDCKCCTENHKKFDFWVGDWIVKDTLGNKIGENNIYKIQDNCAIQENWTSAGSTGTSYNYYDRKDKTWNQLWVDNQGSQLVLKGEAGENKMILKSTLQKGQRVAFFYHQITWTLQKDGTVLQHWEIYDKNHKRLNSLFKGIYHRRKK